MPALAPTFLSYFYFYAIIFVHLQSYSLSFMGKKSGQPGSPEGLHINPDQPEAQETNKTKIEFEIPQEISVFSKVAWENVHEIFEKYQNNPVGLQEFLHQRLKTIQEHYQNECDKGSLTPEEAKQILENEVLPYSKGELVEVVNETIDKSEDSPELKYYYENLKTWLENLEADAPKPYTSSQENLTPQPEKTETSTIVRVPEGSVLYHRIAQEFEKGHLNIPERFKTLEDYLNWYYENYGTNGAEELRGVEKKEDLLKPYWEFEGPTITIKENGKEKQIKVGASSWFALEYGVQYFASNRVTLAHHVFERKKFKEGYSLEETVDIVPQDVYRNYNSFIRGLAERAYNQEVNAPMMPDAAIDAAVQAVGAEDKEKYNAEVVRQAFQSRNLEEVREWFNNKKLEFIDDFGNFDDGLARYTASGYGELEKFYFAEQKSKHVRSDEPGEIGTEEDRQVHAENRAKREAKKEQTREEWLEERRALGIDFNHPFGTPVQELDPAKVAEFYENSGVKKIEVYEGNRAHVKKPDYKALERYRQLIMKYDTDAVVNDTVVERPELKVGVNIPREFEFNVQNTEQLEKYAAVLRRVVETNEGGDNPVVFYRNGKICFGLGNRKDEKLVPVLEFSGHQLVDLVPAQKRRIEEYLQNKYENKFLPPDEFKEMLNTEKMLLREIMVDMGDGEPSTTIAQKVWDTAFKQQLINEVGPEEYARLKQAFEARKPAASVTQAAEPHFTVVRQQDRTLRTENQEQAPQSTLAPHNPDYYKKHRFALNEEVLESPEFKAKEQKYFEKIKRTYKSWEDFLKRPFDMKPVAEFAGFEKPSYSYHVLGEAVLNVPGREAEYEEFKELFGWPSHALAEYLAKHPEMEAHHAAGGKQTKEHYLRTLLLKAVREKPLPGDVWGQERQSGGGRQNTQTVQEVRPSVREQTKEEYYGVPEIVRVEVTPPDEPYVAPDVKAKLDTAYMDRLNRILDSE